MTARDDILAAIEAAVGAHPQRQPEAALAVRIEAHARGPIPARTALDPAALVELFAGQARAVDATVARVGTMDDVAAAIAAYLQAENLPARLVAAPDPALAGIAWTAQPMIEMRRGVPTPSDMVGVTSAVAGIAETGTLVTCSGQDHPATLNFVPETHVAVLPVGRIARSYEDAWDRIRAETGGGPLPRTVNFITGPSRSADIEQTLQLGAHGPRRLHIILVDGEAPAP